MQAKEIKKVNWQYKLLRALACIAKHIFCIKYHGLDLLNKIDAPYIIICNHKSFLDPLAVAYPIKKHVVHFLGKKELEKSKFLKWLLTNAYMIPIDRKNTDIRAIKNAIKVTQKGGVLGIFPEGTRYKSGDMQDPESGVAALIQMCKTPVLAVYIDNKFSLFRRSNVYFLEMLNFDDVLQASSDTNKSDIIMTKIKEYYKNTCINSIKSVQ